MPSRRPSHSPEMHSPVAALAPVAARNSSPAAAVAVPALAEVVVVVAPSPQVLLLVPWRLDT